MPDHEYQPGDPAPACGEYEALSVLGSPTTYRVRVGEPLPASSRGQTWQRLRAADC